MLQILREGKEMTRQKRILSLAGLVSDIVMKDKVPSDKPIGSFKEQFLALPPGPQREALIYNAAIQQSKPNLVPVTIDGPNETKITYNVMPDFFMIDGIRVTAAPATAQKIADHFGMMLPTAKMAKQIYQAADIKTRAVPLSSSGYTDANGVHHSGADVVKDRIGASDAAIHYNDLTNEAIAASQKPDSNGLIAGHGKEIIQPLGSPKDVSFGGWEGGDGKALQPYTVAHKGGANSHTEYGLMTRLIDPNVTITDKNGETVHTTFNTLSNNITYGKFLSDSGKMSSY